LIREETTSITTHAEVVDEDCTSFGGEVGLDGGEGGEGLKDVGGGGVEDGDFLEDLADEGGLRRGEDGERESAFGVAD
jgi:hypothetical protein